MSRANELVVLPERMNSREGDVQASSTADAVARRSYGKLVAFLAPRARDAAAAEDALLGHSPRSWQIGRGRAVRRIRKGGS